MMKSRLMQMKCLELFSNEREKTFSGRSSERQEEPLEQKCKTYNTWEPEEMI